MEQRLEQMSSDSSESTMEDLTWEECNKTIDQLEKAKKDILQQKYDIIANYLPRNHDKKVSDYYDHEKLSQQLFPFSKKDSNITLAVKIFLSSAPAGLAADAAKIFKAFRSNKFGSTFAGLQLGNKIIEWNQTGLVHIGDIQACKASVLFNVHDSIQLIHYTKDLEKKVIGFIQKWNTEYDYSEKHNCHTFVSKFLDHTLGLTLKQCFQGPLGNFINHVIKTGDHTPRLFATSTHKEIVFTSHQELEDVDKQMKEEINWIPTEKRYNLTDEEKRLMKIFHRGFQLQEAANGQDIGTCCHGLLTVGTCEIVNDQQFDLNNVYYSGNI